MKNFLFILFFCALLARSSAQVDRASIIAAYINNFARYTTWPGENQLDSFSIAVFTNNLDIKKVFRAFASKQLIKNKPVCIYFLDVKETLPEKVQIILLTKENSGFLSALYDEIENKPILLVSEDYKEKQTVMINLFEKQEKLQFEVNRANVINQNLIIDPEILLAGGTEIDVAKLYRDSQFNLRNLQDSIDKFKDSLILFSGKIDKSIEQINTQKIEILKKQELLDSSDKRLLILQKTTRTQEDILASQKDSIYYKNIVLQEQMQEEGDMEQYINEQLKHIEGLNKEIENKNKVLESQTVTISRQRSMLFMFIIIGFLTIILIITIFISYRSNKRKGVILSVQKKEIEEKLEELKQLNIKLQDADRYKSIFLASMSHELRTPLNSIIGYTGILLMGMTGNLNDEQNKQLNKVKNNARHLLSLINDILDISKIEADKVELHCEEFSLKALINEVVETIQPKVAEKHLEMNVEISEDISITTDMRRIKQVILNLVSNAVNYSDSGMIRIKAEKLGANKLKLSVKDTGIGIAENELPRLFQPFQQIDSSLTKKNKGTGLGLYLCRKLMILLQGNIYVKSELGKGSEFFIEIPLKIN